MSLLATRESWILRSQDETLEFELINLYDSSQR